ncbi:hypothetical protein B0J14DRAFT_361432 [Halenospora varia]|nr:hypothetical protein B0J14DRAFT_361432 [Halenospora varia]
MPSYFHSLQEARSWLTLICVRLNHFLYSITLDHPSVDYFLPDTMVCVPAELEEEREKYVNEHIRWKEAFDSFVACGPALSDRELLGVRQLELHYLTSLFSGAVARRSDEPWPKTRSFMATFTRMVDISRSILEASKGKERYLFVFGMQIVCPLTVVAWRCPGKRIRREAIDLLRSYPRREGLLTGFINAELIEKLMLAEERNCGAMGEYIPDEMRCIGVSLNVNTAEADRRTLIQCRLPTKIPGVWVTTNDEVCW